MPNKTEYYARLAEEAAGQVTRSREQWTAFLTTAARLYKYPYPDQLMIFTQRPDATACAEYDLWNDRMNRYVKRGSKGIALVDMTGERPRLRYVFDVSDTGERRNSRPVNLWTMALDQESPIQDRLEETFGVSRNAGYLEDQVWEITDQLSREYWNDNKNTIRDIVEESYLADYDDFNIEVSFQKAARISIAYQIFSRCYGNPDDFFDPEDFADVMNFNTAAAANVLGTAVSEMASRIFLEIERAVRNYERSKQAERSQNYDRDNERNDVHTERGLSDSGYPVGNAGGEAAGQIWQNEESVSPGEQHTSVQSSDSDREAVPASLGDSGDSNSENRADDDRTFETESGTGQKDRSDGMGTAHEHAESAGRGNRDSGTYNQLNLFSMFPSEQAQINRIDSQVETPVMTAESVKPSAFSISEEEIERVLRRGSGFAGGKIRIYAMYQQQGDAKARADFLKNEYGTGGSSYTFDDGSHGFVDYDAKGLFIRSYGHDKEVRLKWMEVDKRLEAIVDRGEYLSEKELAQYQQIEADFAGDVPMPSPAHRFPPENVISRQESIEKSAQMPEKEETENTGIDQVSEAVETAEETVTDVAIEPEPEEFRVGDTITLDGKDFIIESVGMFDVHLRDPQSAFPIFRAESKENLERLLGKNNPGQVVADFDNDKESEETSGQVGTKLDIPAQNFRITDDNLGEGSPKEKFRANMDAIHTLQTLEAEDRNATPEEQQILSKYVGWGGLADAFDERKSAWSSE